MLDPVISDIQEETVECHQFGTVGSSDHDAVLTQVQLSTACDEVMTRSIWLWKQADWPYLCQR